ncbi:MAG TPA: TIGR02710 family CRISPR-associated CARF protein [Nitrospira sp.]|nr:TIGR02710 family CRISPR-associated CARF protein [Nitrospira sp.]
MPQEQPVAALVIVLKDELESAIVSINRLQPDTLCFVLPATLKPAVEQDLQPRIHKMPRRWDWVALADPDNFPACHHTLARSLPPMLATWAVEPGALVADLTGATPSVAAALALTALPYTSRIIVIADPAEGRQGDPLSIGTRERLWMQANPWDEAAESVRREAGDLFNRGAFVAAASLFRRIEQHVSGGQKPLSRAFVDLAEGYDLWERFQYRQAWEKLKTSAKAMEMASLFGGPPGLTATVSHVKANASFLEKLVLDPADVKEGLLLDLLAHAGRRLQRNHDAEGAMIVLARALEATAQRQLFKTHKIKTWDVRPEQLPQALQELCRTCLLDDIDGKFKLPLQVQFRILAALGDPLGQAFLREWPSMKTLLDAGHHAVLGHGFEPIKAERVQQLYDVALRLSGVSEGSLPRFPTLGVS